MQHEIEALKKMIDELMEMNAHLQSENKVLRQKVQALLTRLFGRKSEKVDPNQLQMELELLGAVMDLEESGNDDDDDEPPPPKGRRKNRRSSSITLSDKVEEIRTVVDPPEVKDAPSDYVCIGQEESSELDVEPMRVIKRTTVRRKFRRKDRSQVPVLAPAAKCVIPNSMASAGLLSHVVEQKFVYHMPLYRISKSFQSAGAQIHRKLLSSWLMQVGNWFPVILDEMKRELFSSGYLQSDETPVQYLSPGNGQTKRGYFWTHLSPGHAVIFDWHTGRGTDCLDMLDTFSGHVQCDGYGAYGSYNDRRKERGLDPLVLSGCWAHARRKFVEAGDCPLAKRVLREIQHLYRIEAKLREQKAGPEDRLAMRRAQSRPVIERLHGLIINEQGPLPQSPTAKALNYARNQWERLTRFLENGALEIDNNGVENMIRPAALGRKNWLFMGSAEAGETSATLFSIVQTCCMLEIDAREYLSDVLTRLPHLTSSQARELTPAKWLAGRQSHAKLA